MLAVMMIAEPSKFSSQRHLHDNGKDEHTAGGHTTVDRDQGIASTRTRNYRSGIDENLKPIDKNQGIASTRTRDYRLRIDENLDHSP